MSSFTNAPSNLDNLLLQTLMSRLQIRPPPTPTTTLPGLFNDPLLPLSLDDLLLDLSDDDDGNENPSALDSRSQVSKEEAKLEKEIIRVILSGKTDSLKPNSGQAVTIGEHHICVGFHEEKGSDYRVWEWHGHLMLFDEEDGFSPEYIYGNYFERLFAKANRAGAGKVEEEEEEEEDEEEQVLNEEDKMGHLGLKELIGGGDSGNARILHRNVNAGSQRLG